MELAPHGTKLSAASRLEAGYSCEIYKPASDPGPHTMQLEELPKWLKSLRKPVGLLVSNDQRAREVLDACRLAGIHVPEEIAVLGVNDDELICEMANPALSSVTHKTRRIGYEAAAMLHRLMQGKKVIADIEVDPLGVTRDSPPICWRSKIRKSPLPCVLFVNMPAREFAWTMCWIRSRCRGVRWKSDFARPWAGRRTSRFAACSSST